MARALAAVMALTLTFAAAGSVRAAANVPHVMVIVEENRAESAVIGSPEAPYINDLAQQHGVATAAYAQSHPSLPNYLELLSGSTQGVNDDGTGYHFSGPTLVTRLTERHITWRAYMEGMPAACFKGAGSGGYAKKHDPFMYFDAITDDATECAGVVPFTSFTADLAANDAPSFIWVTPNLCDDGHDCSTATADSWLAANLPRVLSSPWFAADGIVIITWDEGSGGEGCCNGAAGGHVATIVISSRVHDHVTEVTPVDHAGTLRTIEQLYGVAPIGDSACACSGDLMPLAGRPQAATVPVTTWLSVPRWR